MVVMSRTAREMGMHRWPLAPTTYTKRCVVGMYDVGHYDVFCVYDVGDYDMLFVCMMVGAVHTLMPPSWYWYCTKWCICCSTQETVQPARDNNNNNDNNNVGGAQAEQIKAAGGTITREPGPVPGIGTKIVATTDPDGWKVVLVDYEDFLKEL